MTDDTTLVLITLVGSFVVGAALLYFVVRGAVVSALRHHALWRADGSFEVELKRHQRDNAN